MFAITREAVTIFGFSVRWYGVLIALGIALAIILSEKREKQRGLPDETTISMVLWVLPAAIVCARIYYVAFSFDAYRNDLLRVLNIREGGLAIYGGIIGGVITGVIWARKKRVPVLALADAVAPGLALAQAVGRWGNFLNQEAYGVRIENPRLRFFPLAVFIRSEGDWFAATFFYESAWCFLICVVILALERKKPLPRRGYATILYVILYAFERTLVEGLRTDSLYWGGVRISQLLSAVMLIACAVICVLTRKKSAAKRIFLTLTAVVAVPFIACCVPYARFPAWALPLCDAITAAIALSALFPVQNDREFTASPPRGF